MCHCLPMDQRVSDQLNKVLALADSNHDGEALVAVRKARQILSRGGLSFGDLAMAAAMPRSRINLPFSFFSDQHSHLEGQISQLRSQLNALQMEIEMQNAQVEFWRRRAHELEQNLNIRSSEVQRWRQLAQETVDKLWDIGQEIRKDEFTSPHAAAVPAGATTLKTTKHS